MGYLDDKIKRLQIKRLRQEVTESEREAAKRKKEWFFSYKFPAILQFLAVLGTGLILWSTNFFDISRKELEYEKIKLELENYHAASEIKEQRRILKFIEDSIRNKEIYYESVIDKKYERIIDDMELAIPKFIFERSIQESSIYDANTFVTEYKKSSAKAQTYQYIKSRFHTENDTIKKIYIEYLLMKCSNEISFDKFMDDLFRIIESYYHQRIAIDVRILNVLQYCYPTIEQGIIIQIKILDIINRNPEDDYTINYNNSNLLTIVGYFTYMKRPSGGTGYYMYRENTYLFLDFLQAINKELFKDSVYVTERTDLHNIIAYSCPPLALAYEFEGILTLSRSEDEFRNNNIYRGNTISPYGFSYGEPLIKRISTIRELYYKEPEIKVPGAINFQLDVDSVILNKWTKKNMLYFKDHPDELVDAIDNNHL